MSKRKPSVSNFLALPPGMLFFHNSHIKTIRSEVTCCSQTRKSGADYNDFFISFQDDKQIRWVKRNRITGCNVVLFKI